MDYTYKLMYLGACHAYNWEATDSGYRAFVAQIKNGLRDETGRIIWGPDNEPK